MKRLLRAAARLYPRGWRARYGAEFDALLDDIAPSWHHLFNILLGAITMRLKTSAVLPLFVAGGAFIGIVVSWAMPSTYMSSSQIVVRGSGPDGRGGDSQRIRAAVDAALEQAEVRLRESDVTRKRVAVAMHPDDASGGLLLDVSAFSDSPLASRKAVERAVSFIIDANFVTGQRRTDGLGLVFRAAAPKMDRASKQTVRGGGIGAALGLCVWVAIVFLRREPKPIE